MLLCVDLGFQPESMPVASGAVNSHKLIMASGSAPVRARTGFGRAKEK